MKIAINCAFYYPKAGGIKEYIYNVVWNLSRINATYEFVLYFPDNFMAYAEETLPKEFRKKSLGFTTNQAIKRSLLEQAFWSKEERLERFDLFHSPFFHSPKFRNAKVILTVHDLRLETLPQTYSKLRLLFLKYKVPKSIKRADHIITISSFTKSEVMKYYGVAPAKITPILEAINFDFFNKNNVDDTLRVLDSPFVLTVGHIETRKNYVRLIDAYEQFLQRNPQSSVKLVIVGQLSHGYDEFLSRVERNPRVIYKNFVESDVLLWLYKHAEFFIMPSIYEGFGFPPLEAAAMGTVSAVSNVSSLPEVCGEAAYYFDPFSVEEISRSFDKLLFDVTYKDELLELTKKNLNRFSWTRNVEETLQVYGNVLETKLS
ncbi:MAG TPA: glycosyltransferase family 1 protein [Sphingobacterium bovisgrunnientis]|nr:glycosyltransferase family 1 protein [Sphingobacterium bovisgrunnientis]